MTTERYGDAPTAEGGRVSADEQDAFVFRGRRKRGRGRLRAGAVVAVVLAVGVVAWFLVRSNGDSSTPAGPPAAGGAQATLVSATGLRAMSRATHEPIYWVGRRSDTRLELSRPSAGRTFVRYLSGSAAAGADKPFLTVGTYALPNAYAATRAAARKPGSTRIRVAGGVAFYSNARQTSVYVAFSGSDYQIEVYDPDAATAARLVRAGLVKAVAPGAAAVSGMSARFVPAGRLGAFARGVGHAIFWAGPMAGDRYEATEAAGGNVYIRYLPRGVAAGSTAPHLTIGTYPVKNAYAVTRAVLKTPSAHRVAVPGGVGVYSAARPNNVYVAFPSGDFQIEVYSPSAAQARRIAARLKPLG